MISRMNIENDPIFIEFIDSRNITKSTEIRYKIILEGYSKYTNLSLSELIKEADTEEENGILKLRDRTIKKHLVQYKKYLQDQNRSESTISVTIAVIRSFYNEFEITLPRTKSKPRYKQKQSIDDLPKKEDIIHALQFTKIKYRAIILLMASSGMGRSEIVNLTYKDFLNSISEYIDHTEDIGQIKKELKKRNKNHEVIVSTWNIKRVKTRMPYTTFSTYESIEAILLYLETEPIKDGTHLFRSVYSNESLSEGTIGDYFYKLNFNAGFGKVDRQIFFRSHNLRKFFTNVLYKNKLRETSINWMLGHEIDSVSESYFKSNITDLKEDYVTCIPDLSMKNVKVDMVRTKDKQLLLDKMKEIDSLSAKIKLLEEDLERRTRLNEYPDVE